MSNGFWPEDGTLPDNWEQSIAGLLKQLKSKTGGRLGVDEATLNKQPFPVDEQGVVTDVRSNADIWQDKVDNSKFAGAQDRAKGMMGPILEPIQEMLMKFLAPAGIGPGGGTKTRNSPIPAPPQPTQDQLKFAQEASQSSRNQMQSRYMNDANSRSQVAKQVTRSHDIDKLAGLFNKEGTFTKEALSRMKPPEREQSIYRPPRQSPSNFKKPKYTPRTQLPKKPNWRHNEWENRNRSPRHGPGRTPRMPRRGGLQEY